MTADNSVPGSRLRRWYKAFRGFYSVENGRKDDFVTRFLFSARSVILVISAQAAIISGLLAYIYSNFRLLNFIILFIGFIDAHALSNLSNDYFGYFRGDDSPDSPRRIYTIHPIADGVITRSEAKFTLSVLLIVGILIAAYFTITVGYLTLIFFGIGIALLFFYDAAPTPLKAVGLGELASFLAWGPVMITGGYYVISGTLSYVPLIASIPYGLGVMSILWGKHIDQMDYDSGKGIRTMPVIIGGRASKAMGAVIISSAFIITLISVLYGILPVTLVIVAISIPPALRGIQRFRERRPEKPPEGFVGWPLWYHRGALTFNKRFGWSYILSFLVCAILIHFSVIGSHLFL